MDSISATICHLLMTVTQQILQTAPHRGEHELAALVPGTVDVALVTHISKQVWMRAVACFGF